MGGGNFLKPQTAKSLGPPAGAVAGAGKGTEGGISVFGT